MSKNNTADKTYATALAELEIIVQALEDETTGIDELTEKVKTAAQLIAYCRNKLRATEDEIAAAMENINGK